MAEKRRSAPLEFDYRGKYRIVGDVLRDQSGTLLDVGSRDGVLKKHLPSTLDYKSADLGSHADYPIDLERPLTFETGQFDVVVALDVLEHVENFHSALSELLRIASRTVIIALPNMAVLEHRFSFLWCGRFASDKYDLPIDRAVDRHRWLTTHSQVVKFFDESEKLSRLRIQRTIGEVGGGTATRLIGAALLKCGMPFENILCARTIHVLSKS